MSNLQICPNCSYGYNEDWSVKPEKNKVYFCPKCKDKFGFDKDLNSFEIGFGEKLTIKAVYEGFKK